MPDRLGKEKGNKNELESKLKSEMKRKDRKRKKGIKG